jgi:hypothetical protein
MVITKHANNDFNAILVEKSLGSGTHATSYDNGNPFFSQPCGEKPGLMSW